MKWAGGSLLRALTEIQCLYNLRMAAGLSAHLRGAHPFHIPLLLSNLPGPQSAGCITGPGRIMR
jgi:hypothetical protein